MQFRSFTKKRQEFLIQEREEKIEDLIDRIQTHRRKAHVAGEFGKLQEEDREWSIVKKLSEKVDRLDTEIEELKHKPTHPETIELFGETIPLATILANSPGPPPKSEQQVDWEA